MINETSKLNSTTTPLNAGQTFTGEAEFNNLPDLMVSLKTDQNGTLYIDFSPDGVNWDSTLSFIYDTSRINPPHVLVKGGRHYRVRFTNTSAVNQTYLRLETYYGYFQKLTAPINGTLAENYDAIVVRPNDYKSEVAMGKRQGRTTWNKYGFNGDIDIASAEVIASFGGTFTPMTAAQTLSIVSTSTNDTSAGTGARTILVIGLGSNGLSQTEAVTLNGTTPVVTSNTWLGVNRMVVTTAGTGGVNAGDITATASGFGTNQAQIPTGYSITQQAIFHVQDNHTFLGDFFFININKVSGGGGSPTVQILGKYYSRTTGVTITIFRADIDTSVENTIISTPNTPFVANEDGCLYFTASTDTNNTAVNFRFSGIEERVS